MKLDYKSAKLAFLDFESQSLVDLRTSTLRKYAMDETTNALTCCVKVGDTMHRMGPYLGDADKATLLNIAQEHTLVAHNAPFDAHIWEHTLKLPEATWLDTLPLARAAGFPGGLDKLSLAMGGRGKDKAGARLIDLLCILKHGKVPAIGPAHDLLMDYNAQDVEELEFIYQRVKDFGEHDVIAVDRIINERGIPVDRPLLNAIIDIYEQNAKANGDELAEKAKLGDKSVNPKSSKQMIAWLASQGFDIDSIGKPVVLALLGDPEKFYVGDSDIEAPLKAIKEVIELRREVAGIGRGKADKILSLIDHDGIIRDQLIYCGAHTGRWTSRGMQLHNMPSTLKAVDTRILEPTYPAILEACRVAGEATKTVVTVSDVLGVMLRRVVDMKEVIAADYASVEARCLAWVAKSTRMLSIYADTSKSLYLDMGKSVFQREISKKLDPKEYQISKAIVLGCGYGMSGAKFDFVMRTRESREVLDTMREAGVDAYAAVKQYRSTYPEIPVVWKECGAAVLSAVQGSPSEAARCQFIMVGKDLHMVLPSGRPMVYRNARIEMQVPAYCAMYGMPEVPIPTVIYDGIRGRGFLYAAKICVGADTRVITNRGILPIISVLPGDKVWDGENWVKTDGCVYNGNREVGVWQGVTMTPDHMIHDGKSWRAATSLDEEATTCSLKSAAILAPWLSSRLQADTMYTAIAKHAAASVAGQLNTYEIGRHKIFAAYRAHTAEVGERRMKTERLLPAMCSGGYGLTDIQGSYRDAITRRTKLTQAMAAGAFKCMPNGERTEQSFSVMQSHLQDGTTHCYGSTESTMTVITSQETYGLLHRPKVAETHVKQFLSSLRAQCTKQSKYMKQNTAISQERRSFFSSIKGSSPVYDLLNCGPKNRYMLVTEDGLALSHNCENACQAICRDLLADAVVKCEQAGLCPRIHVHDEIVCQNSPDKLNLLLQIMSEGPSWAKGFPILVEGYAGDQWTKTSYGYIERNALGGKIL